MPLSTPLILRAIATLCLGANLAAATPPADYLCLPADAQPALAQWTRENYYTGHGLRARNPDTTAPSSATLTLALPRAGTYRVFVLGARAWGKDAATCPLRLSLTPAETATPVTELDLRFHDHNAIAWTDLDARGQPGASLHVPAPGQYTLRLTAPKTDGFFVEKILFTDQGYVPVGMGPTDQRPGAAPPANATVAEPGIVLPPAWAFGVLYGGYTSQAQTLDAVQRLAAADFPIDAYWIDSWFWCFQNQGYGPGGYMSFVEDKTAFPDVAALWGELQRRHIKAGVWIWDCILREGNERTFDEFLARNFFSDVFINRDRWHNLPGIAICGNIDFANPAATAHWQQKLAPFFAAGLDFLKIDRSSALPFTQAAFEATRKFGRETRGRGFILAHLHTAHDPRTKLYPAKWSGDASVSWSQPNYPDNSVPAMGGLRETLALTVDPRRSTYDVPFLAHDAGGYVLLKDGKVTDELYTRWLQFSALNSLTTLFSSQQNPTRNHPTAFSAHTQDIARRYLQLRLRLFPYLYSAALETRLTGRKMIQGDGAHVDQYLLGPSLLVAPVITAGATSRDVALPEGKWFDWDTGAELAGGRDARIDAPLEKLPLFVRAGTLVPLRDYASSIEAGTNDHLTLEIFPGGDSTYILREDDGTSEDYLTGGYASTTLHLRASDDAPALDIAPVDGTYAGMAPSRRWTLRFHGQPGPRPLSLDGHPLESRYDAATRTLTCEFSADKGAAHRVRCP